ncbi:hypothetical protein [Streptomyces sp. NPDC059168]|uniref:hypothetical protein n=1 Tax=Streptomyces sp. NPDC059168 TaxID=3346753 RepID=UPI0036A86C5B
MPARTETPAGRPPTWIGVRTLDLLHEECTLDAELLRVEGAYHGYDTVDRQTPVSKDFVQAQLPPSRHG